MRIRCHVSKLSPGVEGCGKLQCDRSARPSILGGRAFLTVYLLDNKLFALKLWRSGLQYVCEPRWFRYVSTIHAACILEVSNHFHSPWRLGPETWRINAAYSPSCATYTYYNNTTL